MSYLYPAESPDPSSPQTTYRFTPPADSPERTSPTNGSPLAHEVIVQEEYEDTGTGHFFGRRGYEPFPGSRRLYETLNVEQFQLPNQVRKLTHVA